MVAKWVEHPVFQDYLARDAIARDTGLEGYRPGIYCDVQGSLISSCASPFAKSVFGVQYGVFNFLKAVRRLQVTSLFNQNTLDITILSRVPQNALIYAGDAYRHFPADQITSKCGFKDAVMGLMIDDAEPEGEYQALVRWNPKEDGPHREFLAQFGALAPLRP